jgi:hypothetical protein
MSEEKFGISWGASWSKNFHGRGFVAFVAILFAWADALAVRTDEEGGKKGAKGHATAAPSPTTKAAQAFEKVSKELYKAKQEGNLIIYPCGTWSTCAPSPMPS